MQLLSISSSEREGAQGGDFPVTFVDTVTPLELERSVFDSEETRILSAAFKKAWAYVQFDPMLGALEELERQSELARCLMTLLKLGQDNPVTLANSAIALLRKIHKNAQNRSRIISRRTYDVLSSATARV